MSYIIKSRNRPTYGLRRGVTLNEIPRLIEELEEILERESQKTIKEEIDEEFIPFELV